MALYPPPREIVPIFDSFNFDVNNTALTVDSGLEYFLAFPTAQGEETLANTIVAGSLTALGTANFSSTTLGSLTSSATQPASNNSSTIIPTTAWVQTAISGGGGAASTLSQVLIAGNSAGATSINMNTNNISNINNMTVLGTTTTSNQINMLGDYTTAVISACQHKVKSYYTGVDYGSTIRWIADALEIYSGGNTGVNTSLKLFSKDSAGVNIEALTITPTVTNSSLPLDMTGGNSTLETIKSRVYNFKDVATGASTTTRIYQDGLDLALDNTQLNSSIIFQTRTSGNVLVTPLRIESSQLVSNVALDMINNSSAAFGYLNASIRSRVYLLRDLTTSAITSCGMYFSGNILQIDSTSGSASTPTSMFLRTTKTDGSLTNALQLTNTTVKTDCYAVTALPANDNSNSIPTTTWVQSLLSAYIPPALTNVVRIASSAGSFTTTAAGNQFLGTFNIPLSGGSFLVPDPTNGWEQNQGVTFRVNYFQSFTPRSSSPNDSQNYISFSGMLTLYPWRFQSIGWLSAVVSNGPRGRVSDNVLVTADGNSNTNYITLDTTTCSAGRQFWSNAISFQSNGSFLGRLFVYGGTTINDVRFELSKPSGYSAANELYSYTCSIELVNQSNTFSTITSSGFNISNL
jgi:hypothetical protein